MAPREIAPANLFIMNEFTGAIFLFIKMKVKIYKVEGELNASITKGYLESFGIHTSIAPGSMSLGKNGSRGPNVGFDIFAEESEAEEAVQILKERDINNN